MSTPAQRRGRNYMIIGLLMIGGAAGLYYYANALTTDGVMQEAFLTRMTWVAAGFAGIGALAIVIGAMTRLRGTD